MGSFNGDIIPRVPRAHHTHTRIACKHTLQAFCRFRCTIRDDDLACVLAITDAHPTAMMERDPGGATDRID